MNTKKPQKIYSTNTISICTALFSLAAGGYMLYINYRAVGKEKYGRNILIYSTVSLFLILGAVIVVPVFENIPNIIIPIVSVVAMQDLAKRFHKSHAEDIDNLKLENHPWYKSLLVSIVALASVLIAAFAIFMFIPDAYSCEVDPGSKNGKVYDQYEATCFIYHDLEGEIQFQEIDKVLTLEAKFLEDQGLYDPNSPDDVVTVESYSGDMVLNYEGILTDDQIDQILDSELGYFDYIGVLEEK